MRIIDPVLGRSGSDQEVHKFSHHFEEKQKVRVKADGRTGGVENFNAKQHVNVRLDSGHLIECHPDEIEPADWQDSAPAKLQRAIAAGRVSVHDQVVIQNELEKISTGSYAVDPFGETLRDSPSNVLKLFAEKYGEDGDALAKRAASKFHIGQKVIEKSRQRTGTVVDVTAGGLVEIRFSPSTSALCVPSDVAAA